jgi:hypothetical protein
MSKDGTPQVPPFELFSTSGRCGPRSVRTGKVLFFGVLHAVEVKYFIKLPHNTPYILL